MNIPKQIKLLHYTYDIIETNNVNLIEDKWGIISYTDEKIYIKKDITYSNKQVVLLHEIMHFCFHVNENNLIYKPDNDADIKELEHFFINGIEENLAYVIKNNPKVMKYLQLNKGIN